MKIIISIKPSDENDEMVHFTFSHKGKPENMTVARADARMSRAIGEEMHKMLSETEWIQEQLETEEDK